MWRVAVGAHFVSFSRLYSQQGDAQLGPPYGMRTNWPSGPKKRSILSSGWIIVEPTFFTQTSATVAPFSPVAFTISTWLPRRSSMTLAVDVRAPLVRSTLGKTALMTATTATIPATVSRMVVMAFSMVAPPLAPSL